MSEDLVGKIIEETAITGNLDYNIKDLQTTYNSTKDEASKATSALNAKATLNGMEDISKIVASAMKEIQTFTNSTKKPGVMSSMSSKAVAIIDPNNKWAGKWLESSKDGVSEETLKESTMEEIADKVINSINAQREEVVTYMEDVVGIRKKLTSNMGMYNNLLDKAKVLLPTITPDTRDELDTKGLINRLTKSVMQLDSMLSSNIAPLIGAASLAVQKIDEELPDIEHDLKYSGSFKIAQQKLADYIGMAKAVKSMTEEAGDAIRKDIQDTTIESIQMVGDVITNPERLAKIQKEQQEHLTLVHKTMEDTQKKIDENFNTVMGMHDNYLITKSETNTKLISTYAN